MNTMDTHSFHIPVMGIAYTIDTPLKVAHYGISSVISLVDDILIERMREFYSIKFDLPFQAISDKIEDFRAKRITAYLNLLDTLIKEKVDEVKKSISKKGLELEKYFSMLPDSSDLRKRFNQVLDNYSLKDAINWIQDNLPVGSIDVNIMTKLDKENYKGSEQLPIEFNDAHAALRGFAESDLSSSIVLSAGMNPRLYSYFEKFKDFFPNQSGELKKKIILKVSDYRSALIQGKFLAKKGLWISEYRIESGLNCGGHAFATQGYLLGPILEEFKVNRENLIITLYDIYSKALKEKNITPPENPYQIKVTAQGGVGTSSEHQFLLDQYKLDSVGWGTPFLLVPEICNIDDNTLSLLVKAKEDDLYVSDISPLGVPFNTVKGNSKDIERDKLISEGKPGSPCFKKFASLNKEFTERSICVASRQYQKRKISELENLGLSLEEYKKQYDAIVEKSCICNGLGTSVLITNNMSTTMEGSNVSVCPGPNIAYFDEVVSLSRMVDHIYGRTNLIKRTDRPNMFLKELEIYIEYFAKKLKESENLVSSKQLEYFEEFHKNLNDGIEYYNKLFSQLQHNLGVKKDDLLKVLNQMKKRLNSIMVVQPAS